MPEVEERSKPGQAYPYVFQPAYGVPEEIVRLDGLHKGLTEYFGQRLSLAPLEDTHPKSILELGSGSGAWAIQAAVQFPEAKVLAVDKSPIPPRPLPPNLHFQQVDLTQPFPFENASFDIVHARLVIMHLPQGADVLRRTFDLVKPGGWLVVEDPDDDSMTDDGKPIGPAMTKFVSTLLNMIRARGANPCIGRDLESILKSSGYFSEVNVRKVSIPYTQKSQDPAENKLGLAWLVNARQVTRDLGARFAEQGLDPELGKEHLRELEDPNRNITTDMYFSWSRRKLD